MMGRRSPIRARFLAQLYIWTWSIYASNMATYFRLWNVKNGPNDRLASPRGWDTLWAGHWFPISEQLATITARLLCASAKIKKRQEIWWCLSLSLLSVCFPFLCFGDLSHSLSPISPFILVFVLCALRQELPRVWSAASCVHNSAPRTTILYKEQEEHSNQLHQGLEIYSASHRD